MKGNTRTFRFTCTQKKFSCKTVFTFHVLQVLQPSKCDSRVKLTRKCTQSVKVRTSLKPDYSKRKWMASTSSKD